VLPQIDWNVEEIENGKMNQDSKQQELIESNKAYTMAKGVCKSQT